MSFLNRMNGVFIVILKDDGYDVLFKAEGKDAVIMASRICFRRDTSLTSVGKMVDGLAKAFDMDNVDVEIYVQAGKVALSTKAR